jgi:hypothetical protein
VTHETHVCRDCGAEITLPYAKPDESLEGYWEKAYWRIVPKLAEALAGRQTDSEPPLIDGCRIVHRADGFDVCRVHYRYWKAGTQMCPGRQS